MQKKIISEFCQCICSVFLGYIKEIVYFVNVVYKLFGVNSFSTEKVCVRFSHRCVIFFLLYYMLYFFKQSKQLLITILCFATFLLMLVNPYHSLSRRTTSTRKSRGYFWVGKNMLLSCIYCFQILMARLTLETFRTILASKL